jgi:hypothetical protein
VGVSCLHDVGLLDALAVSCGADGKHQSCLCLSELEVYGSPCVCHTAGVILRVWLGAGVSKCNQ